MKKLIAVSLTLAALTLVSRPALAEEKNPAKLFGMLTSKLESFKDMGAKYKEDAKFKEFIKYTCQKGNLLGGVFGVCRSGEGVVCGFKKEAYVACSLVCGGLAQGMKEADGFDASKCVTKQGKDKWGFANHEAAIAWAKGELKTKASTLGPVAKLCPMLKKVLGSLPPEVKSFAEACP